MSRNNLADTYESAGDPDRAIALYEGMLDPTTHNQNEPVEPRDRPEAVSPVVTENPLAAAAARNIRSSA